MVETLLQLVYDDPTDLDVRLVLADALAEVGDVIEEAFWRWTVQHHAVPDLCWVLPGHPPPDRWRWLQYADPNPMRRIVNIPVNGSRAYQITDEYSARETFDRLRTAFVEQVWNQ